MSQLLVKPEEEVFPNRKRWTRAECADLLATGRLQGRYELIDGELIQKMGQNPPHSVTLLLFANWLVSLFGKLYVREQEPIRISGEDGDYNDPEPDIAVTRETAIEYSIAHPTPQDLVLIVEVADTTLRFDLGTKALLYARCGVPEYWVADVVARRVHIYSGPSQQGYTEIKVSSANELATVAPHSDSTVAVNTLFPPPALRP